MIRILDLRSPPRPHWWLVALVLLAGTDHARAYRRILEVDGRLEKPIWGTVAGLGFYTPDATTAESGPQITTGLRYIRPDVDDATWHSIAYELTASSFSASAVEIVTFDGGVFYYYPRRDDFSFDYHWFVGGGIGIAEISRPRFDEESAGVGFFTAGLQGRIRDFFVEAKYKMVASTPNTSFPVDGSVVMLTGTYYFLP